MRSKRSLILGVLGLMAGVAGISPAWAATAPASTSAAVPAPSSFLCSLGAPVSTVPVAAPAGGPQGLFINYDFCGSCSGTTCQGRPKGYACPTHPGWTCVDYYGGVACRDGNLKCDCAPATP